MVLRLSLSLGLFIGSLAAGWWFHRRGWLNELRASQLVRIIVQVSSPIVLCALFWQMDLRDLETWLLPLLGLVISLAALIPAYFYCRHSPLSSPQSGSFLTCALFSNVGYLGAFVAFALYGELAYGWCMLYLLFFTPCFYTLGFWIAARYGHPQSASKMGIAFKDQLRLYPFLGMLAGFGLNLANVPRPAGVEGLNHLLIPLNTALYLVAIGSQILFESPLPWRHPCLTMSAIKFIYSPMVAYVLLRLLNVSGPMRSVILLEASMPVAVSPLVLPLLFGLDRSMANALWLWTTVLSIPYLLLLIRFLEK
ncbi:MAG: hypothetical protein HYT88_03060 [Candidatus Omnitrophica bacterium]|nr:hypothetical protein [Candidatus Omnitrophota bacterium]